MELDMRAVRKIDVWPSSYQREDASCAVSLTRGGKPIEGIKSERIKSLEVEEELMTWKNASHIHGWFVDNVQKGTDDSGTYRVDREVIETLLEVCEKVLNASHIVWEPAFKATGWKPIRQRLESRGVPLKVMKNISVAHKLLPIRIGKWDGPTDYGEQYLKDVEVTRDWAERTLLDIEGGKLQGQIFYRGC